MKKEILNYSYILFGCLFLSLGVIGFLGPNQIATGGTAGLAIVLHHVFNLSTGVLFAIINIPLLLLSIKYLGKHFAIKSIFAISTLVLVIHILENVVKLKVLSEDFMLASLYGGIAIGLGLGLIFKGGGSAGGGTIIAKIICSKYPIKTGTVVFVLDALVVVSTAIVFNSIELALWSMINIFVATKLIDTVLTGRPNEKIVHISSNKALKPLGVMINEQINVSGTYVNGQNLGLTESKDILFISVPKNRVNALKQLVHNYDINARMIVMDAAELSGPTSISKV